MCCTFWLRNVLRATTACTFSTSQLPKVVRSWGVLYILTWKCASRHNGVHFFDISTSKSGPKLRCFVHFDFSNVLRATTACTFSSLIWPPGSAHAALASLLFDPPEPQIIGKHGVSRLSYLFAHLHLLSSYSFSSDLLSSNFPLLSASALLCFSSVHIVGSLTSKLQSIIYVHGWSLSPPNMYIYIHISPHYELTQIIQINVVKPIINLPTIHQGSFHNASQIGELPILITPIWGWFIIVLKIIYIYPTTINSHCPPNILLCTMIFGFIYPISLVDSKCSFDTLSQVRRRSFLDKPPSSIILQAKEKVTPKSCLRGFPHCHHCFQKSRLSHA